MDLLSSGSFPGETPKEVDESAHFECPDSRIVSTKEREKERKAQSKKRNGKRRKRAHIHKCRDMTRNSSGKRNNGHLCCGIPARISKSEVST